MTLELLNQRFPPPGGQSFRAHHRPLRLAERVWILKPEHAHLAHHAQGDRVVLHDGYLRLHLDLQVIRAARCRRGQAGENAAPALFVLIDLDCGGSFVFRRHNKANQDRRQHAKARTTCHNGLPLPRNQRKFPQRHLVAGIGEALPFYELASGPARLSFIRFGQVSSFFPLFGWWFTQSGPGPLARALCRQHNRCKLWIGEPLAKFSSTADYSDGSGILIRRRYLAIHSNSVWSIFGYGPDEDSDFQTRRDHGCPVLIKVFGFPLTTYVMSLRI